MANTCESAIKTVNDERAKVVVLAEAPRGRRQEMRLWPKWQRGTERGFNGAVSWMMAPTGRQQVPNLTHFLDGTWKPRRPPASASAPASGPTVRWTDRSAGLGCRKKRMPRCNGADTGPCGRTRKRAHVRRVSLRERV
jgi:hypothetical protein